MNPGLLTASRTGYASPTGSHSAKPNWEGSEEPTGESPSSPLLPPNLPFASTSGPLAMSISPHQPSRRYSLSSSPNLLGSYTNSLLEGRMSMSPSQPVQFSLQVGVLGFPPCPPSLRCPPHITMDFPASWYELAGPYVGSAFFEDSRPFNSVPCGDAEEPAHNSDEKRRLARHGYRLPPRGQLQLVLKNQLGTIVKVLLIPYDLTDMRPGSKTFLRVRYVTAAKGAESGELTAEGDMVAGGGKSIGSASGKGKEVTRYAVHLHFVSPPNPSRPRRRREKSVEHSVPFDMDMEFEGHTGSEETPEVHPAEPKKTPRPRIFLSKSVRMVFPSRTPDSEEVLQPVREEPGDGANRYSSWTPNDSSSKGMPPSPSPREHKVGGRHVRKKSLLGSGLLI